MQIEWLGHSCFLLTTAKGVKIVTDPYDETIGYNVPDVSADIVTVSHDHYDHNAINLIGGLPVVIKEPGEYDVSGVKIKGVVTYHDSTGGWQRGKNLVFVINVDDLRICHLGDIGHILNFDQIKSIGKIDVLLIPIGGAQVGGGTYTIDADKANLILEQLKPRLVIPMHYRTSGLVFRIDTEEKFVRDKKNVRRVNSSIIGVSAKALPEETQVLILNHSR